MESTNSSIAYGTPGYKALKGLVVGLSTATTLCSLIFIGLSVFGFFADRFSGYADTIPQKTLGVGLVLFFISFLGCIGALFENKKLLHSYFSGFMVLVLVQAVALLVALFKGVDTREVLNKIWDDAYRHSPGVLRDIQYKFECCGFNNIFDRALPKTHADACVESPYFGYTMSCYSSLAEIYNHNYIIINVILGILVLVQGVSLCFAWILADKTPSSDENDSENGLLNSNGNNGSQNYGAGY